MPPSSFAEDISSIQASSRRIDLQRFAVAVIEALDGVADAREYGLLDVVLSQEVSRRAGVPEFASLAFDSDIAKDTPGAEFVTFGSHFLDKLIDLGMGVGQVVRRFAVVPGLRIPPNLMERIESRVGFTKCRRPARKSASIEACESAWFRFMLTYTSDETFSDSITVAVDSCTLGDDTPFMPGMRRVFFADEAALDPMIPETAKHPYREIFDAAVALLETHSKPQFARYQSQVTRFCRDELAKVLTYFESVSKELSARLEAAQDPEKKARLQAKVEAARRERERRISDVLNKYKVSARARLDSVVLSVVPKVRAVLEVQHKDRFYTQEVFFNLATNEVEPPTCPRCHGRFTSGYPADSGVFVCCPSAQDTHL